MIHTFKLCENYGKLLVELETDWNNYNMHTDIDNK